MTEREKYKLKKMILSVHVGLSKIEAILADYSKDDPLKVEKIAVKVNNEREFNILMRHYDSLGWKGALGTNATLCTLSDGLDIIEYNDNFRLLEVGCDQGFDPEQNGYTVIEFDFFCAQKGIPVRKLILTSVDGVDLYEKDNCYVVVCKSSNKWILDYHSDGSDGDEFIFRATDNGKFYNSEEQKVFADKSVAEKWIEKQNKPKEIIVGQGSQYEISVTKNEILIKCKGKIHGDNIIIWPSEIQQINDALKSLQ